MDIPMREYTLTPATEYKPRTVTWLMPGRIPYGGISIMAGRQGTGKSQLTLALAADQTKKGQGVIYIGSEDGMEDTIVPRLVANGADLSHFHNFETKVGDRQDVALLPQDTPLLEQAIKDVGASMVLVDPIAGHLDPNLNTHSDHSLRQALIPLAGMAQRTKASIICVMHLRKSKEGSPLDWLNGGTGFSGVARSVLMFGRARRDPLSSPDRYLIHVKCNLAAMAPALRCEIVDEEFTHEGRTIESSRVRCMEELWNFDALEFE